jgi:hypothetical protein
MNNEEAKFILQGYRPNGSDTGDATFCAALEQARQDPALGEWFARARTFDTAISAKLHEVAAPAGLREAILAGGRVTVPDRSPRPWWRSPAGLAAAASIALLGAVGLALWPKPAADGATLQQFALADTRHHYTHGGHGANTAALQAELNSPMTRLGHELPVDFEALRTAGCRAIGFEGHEVLEVCFKRDGAWFHCYIARRADFPALVAAVTPVLEDDHHAATATWADATHLFVVVSEAGRSSLEKLL